VRIHLVKNSILKDEILIERAAADSVDREELKRLQEELEAETAEIAESMSIFESSADAMRSKLIKEKNVALLTQEIIKIADSYHVELSIVKPLASRAKGDYEVLPMSMNFKTNYERLFKFLDAIEVSSIIVGIEGFTINTTGSDLDVQLTVYTLFQAQPDIVEVSDEGEIT